MSDMYKTSLLRHRLFALPRSALVAKATRFLLVALASGGIFVLVTSLCVSGFAFDPKIGSIAGYVVSLPFNFAAHRQYTFAATGKMWREALRFVCLHAANIAVSVGAAAVAVDGFGLHYSFGIIAALMLVPVVTFTLMNLWVFRVQNA
jgi:putative flippase GtrA